MAICLSCGEDDTVVDPDSGACVCCSCGCVVSTDEFRHQAFTSDGQATGFLHNITDFDYRQRKLHRARSQIEDLTSALGLSSLRATDVSDLISEATDGSFGDGQWFSDLIAACSYIVARRHRIPTSLTEAADAVGRDACDVGHMVTRVVQHLRLPSLPEFNIAAALDRVVNTCQSFKGLDPEKSKELIGQGQFLLNCATKWFLTTGRQPLPLVAAVLAFVADANGVKASVEEIAEGIPAGVTTSKLRLKELTETLIRVARSLLPWGKDVTLQNLTLNAPLLIRLMERKSKSDRSVDIGFGFDAFSGALRKDNEDESKYFKIGEEQDCTANCDNFAYAKLSGECISSAYDKVLERIDHLKAIGGFDKDRSKRTRREILETRALQDAWEGRWDRENKLTLEQVLERDVGFYALPPSFVAGVQSRRFRRAKIEAAKQRIQKIMKTFGTKQNSAGGVKVEDCVVEERVGRKRRRTKKQCEDKLDWEDCIIELLLLHRVEEDEIEQGFCPIFKGLTCCQDCQQRVQQ
ncbi:plant-specific TFIIB-related protein PTF2-like isoform X2 [Zingiber officinale]|uniref:plant-specific TFIIB-related protein PTF2-like isoform X2 n=2 Tax=Zingiber officinale TaxID=94328 RepID=UPI001C4BFB25|nr:plant-specific TFIIB-related protein PTF2-like isoform X2 [Zingiber officinale]